MTSQKANKTKISLAADSAHATLGEKNYTNTTSKQRFFWDGVNRSSIYAARSNSRPRQFPRSCRWNTRTLLRVRKRNFILPGLANTWTGRIVRRRTLALRNWRSRLSWSRPCRCARWKWRRSAETESFGHGLFFATLIRVSILYFAVGFGWTGRKWSDSHLASLNCR